MPSDNYKGWLTAWPPLTSTAASGKVAGSTEQLRSNWEHFELVMSAGHVPLSGVGYGHHWPGRSAGIAVASKATITSYTSAGAGALAYATDTGEFLIRRTDQFVTSGDDEDVAEAGFWGSVTTVASGWSRCKVSLTATISVTPSTVRRINKLDTGVAGTYDDLEEFDSLAGTFTSSGAGYYLVTAEAKFDASQMALRDDKYIHWAAISGSDGYYGYSGSWGDGETTHDCKDMVYLGQGDKICLAVYHESASALSLVAASMCVHRLV